MRSLETSANTEFERGVLSVLRAQVPKPQAMSVDVAKLQALGMGPMQDVHEFVYNVFKLLPVGAYAVKFRVTYECIDSSLQFAPMDHEISHLCLHLINDCAPITPFAIYSKRRSVLSMCTGTTLVPRCVATRGRSVWHKKPVAPSVHSRPPSSQNILFSFRTPLFYHSI